MGVHVRTTDVAKNGGKITWVKLAQKIVLK
jgi:hypothetical protein